MLQQFDNIEVKYFIKWLTGSIKYGANACLVRSLAEFKVFVG